MSKQEKLFLKEQFDLLAKEISKLKREINKLKGIPNCPKCKGSEIIKRGIRPTKNRGDV